MAMRIMSMAALVAVILASTVLQTTYADTYTVGDNTGWTVPPGGIEFYEKWSSNKTFVVGDILDFIFATGAHNVQEVTEAGFGTCNGTDPIASHSSGPAVITLNSTGQHYFICSVPGHCTGGQKLSVQVKSGPSKSAAPTPRSSPKSSTSAASTLVATLSLAIMSAAFALFC